MVQEFDLPDFEQTNYEDLNFEDISNMRKSEAWKFFTYEKTRKLAKCNFCHSILRCHGSTMTLQRHLKTHQNTDKNNL